MDSRIIERISLLQRDEEEKLQHQRRAEMEREERLNSYIESKVPDAEKWVDSFLLDEIAKKSFAASKSETECSIWLQNKDDIPVLSKVKAIQNKKIDGVSISKRYVAEDYDPNDESRCTMIPAHYDYYVVWSL